MKISQDFIDEKFYKIATLFQGTDIQSDIEKKNIRPNQLYTYLALPNDWEYSHWLSANYTKNSTFYQ